MLALRLYTLSPPLPRLEALDTLYNTARLMDGASVNPVGDVCVIAARFDDRTIANLEFHLKGLGYGLVSDPRANVNDGAITGITWKHMRRGEASPPRGPTAGGAR